MYLDSANARGSETARRVANRGLADLDARAENPDLGGIGECRGPGPPAGLRTGIARGSSGQRNLPLATRAGTRPVFPCAGGGSVTFPGADDGTGKAAGTGSGAWRPPRIEADAEHLREPPGRINRSPIASATANEKGPARLPLTHRGNSWPKPFCPRVLLGLYCVVHSLRIIRLFLSHHNRLAGDSDAIVIADSVRPSRNLRAPASGGILQQAGAVGNDIAGSTHGAKIRACTAGYEISCDYNS